MAKVMISMSDELLDRLDEHARRRGTSRSRLLQQLAERELESTDTTRRRNVERLLSGAGSYGGDAAGAVRQQRRAR